MNWELITKIVIFGIGLYVALLSWIGRDWHKKIEDNAKDIKKNREDINHLKASSMVTDEKFMNLKEDLAEIKSDLKKLLTQKR